jgi:hypothetical protein
MAFCERVSFDVVEMIPAHLHDRFDFCWSACCLEHLGSLAQGLRFIENSLNTLKIGGTAIHTGEFNLSSDVATLESRDLSIYRRCDIESLVNRLTQAGHRRNLSILIGVARSPMATSICRPIMTSLTCGSESRNMIARRLA